MIEWTEQKVSAGMAPWVARVGKWMTLFVQPWYGDGINWKGIIQHLNWTLILKKKFSTREEAMITVEEMADRMWKGLPLNQKK